MIVANNPDGVYTHHRAYARDLINDLASHPMVDEEGEPIAIFNKDGRAIPRNENFVKPDAAPMGILLDLRKVEILFEDDKDEVSNMLLDDEDDPVGSDPQVTVYPQAFLPHHGHVQSKGIMPVFREALTKINRVVGMARSGSSTTDDNDVDDEETPEDEQEHSDHHFPVIGISFQAYNEIMHCVQPTARSQEVNQGWVTAALGGCYATLPNDQSMAIKKAADCMRMFPHERIFKRIEDRDPATYADSDSEEAGSAHRTSTGYVPRDLRLEQVYSIDLHQMKSSKRSGW